MVRYEVLFCYVVCEGIKEDMIICIVFDFYVSEFVVSCLRKSLGMVVKVGMGEYWLRGLVLVEGCFGVCLIMFMKFRLIFEVKC